MPWERIVGKKEKAVDLGLLLLNYFPKFYMLFLHIADDTAVPIPNSLSKASKYSSVILFNGQAKNVVFPVEVPPPITIVHFSFTSSSR